ncbi:Ubiquitin carboxyl-terminal hydrolase family protein [Acanthocheilonema viteae]
MSEEEIPPIEILESLLLQDESLCKEVLESLLSQQLISRNEAQDLLRSHGMDLTYTESPQKKSCHRGERLSVGYHSDTDVNLMEKEKKRKIRKRKLSGDLGCHQRSETTVFKLRREMVEDTWLNMVNDNKENIPPRNLAESKQKIQECKSASDEPKKMLTYKKFSHHEMTIIPIGYLQINREAFCNRDIIYRRNRSIMHHTSQDVENLGNDEIVDFFGLQPVPYKPLSEGKRNEICALIGLFPRENWMIESSICWMSMYDEPDFLVAVPGNDNRLYQALAHYITGDSNDFHQIRQAIIQFEVEHPAEFMNLKQWDKIAWHSHLNTLFSNTENGSDVELFALASKFKVDIWIFHKQQWFCYRPKFLVVNGQCKNLSIQQYHIGENEGIYLHYENGVFFPVFKPSNNWLSTEHFCRMDSNDSVIMTQPSYRLISFVNHLGEEVDSGHYISNIWCNESKTWILCDDESVEQISERSVQTKSTTGYIFFYLHREVFENE